MENKTDEKVVDKRVSRSPRDQARLEFLLKSPLIRVETIPGEGRKGLDPKNPFYKRWEEENGGS